MVSKIMPTVYKKKSKHRSEGQFSIHILFSIFLLRASEMASSALKRGTYKIQFLKMMTFEDEYPRQIRGKSNLSPLP